jgi:hypothetical protein
VRSARFERSTFRSEVNDAASLSVSLDRHAKDIVFEGRLGPSWLLDRAVERSRRGWALSSGAETGAVEIAG